MADRFATPSAFFLGFLIGLASFASAPAAAFGPGPGRAGISSAASGPTDFGFKRVLTLSGGLRLSTNDTLTGQVVVGRESDSASLQLAGAAPAESISIGEPQLPDFGAYIAGCLSGVYQLLSSSQISNSSPGSPLMMGLNSNGIYYAPAGLDVVGIHDAVMTIFGFVRILVHGSANIGPNLQIQAGNGSAFLLIASDATGSDGLSFDSNVETGGLPLLLWTRGTITMKKSATLGNVSMACDSASFSKDETFAYHHFVMDFVIDSVIRGTSLADVPGGASGPAPALDFALMENPVRGTARAVLTLRRSGPARLAVYDARGRRVRALMNATAREGRHDLSWDLRNSAGRRVPAGTYYLRAQSAGQSQTRKLVVVR